MEEVKVSGNGKGNDVLKRYFSDILILYNAIYETKKTYEHARKQLLDVKDALSSRRKALRGTKGFVAYLLVLAPFVATEAVIWLCGWHSVILAAAMVTVIPATVYIIARLIYEKRVYSKYLEKSKDKLDGIENDYWRAYNGLMNQYDCLKTLIQGLEKECAHPLAVYIMLKAVQSGECHTIYQCNQYYQSRYRILQDSKASALIKQEIKNPEELRRQLDGEAITSEELIEYLKGLVSDMVEVTNKNNIISEPTVIGGNNNGK